MIKKFECELCEEVFSSGFEMAQHFRTEEHMRKGAIGNLDSLIVKFFRHIKTNIENKLSSGK